MSVIIKGIGMPTGNDELRLIIRSNGQVIISHKTYFDETEAIFVPPHGDLIDRDELIERAWRLNLSTRELIEEMLKTAHTIIPAEEGKT